MAATITYDANGDVDTITLHPSPETYALVDVIEEIEAAADARDRAAEQSQTA